MSVIHDDLRKAVEEALGRKMLSHADFELLADSIFEKTHQTISPTTLKRLWGYLTEPVVPRRSTLDLLAQFVGCRNFDDFCAQHPSSDDAGAEHHSMNGHATVGSFRTHRTMFQAVLFIVLAIGIFLVAWLIGRSDSGDRRTEEVGTGQRMVLHSGQRFKTYQDYLGLFGIKATSAPWHQELPGHPNIVLWGPEYQHPVWQNLGNIDSLMPTITEYWTAPNGDSLLTAKMNNERFFTAQRLRDIRITFMREVPDSDFIFLGIYRMSLALSDSSRIVWERVSPDLDLNSLDKLEKMR